MRDLMYQDVPDPSLSENAEGKWRQEEVHIKIFRATTIWPHIDQTFPKFNQIWSILDLLGQKKLGFCQARELKATIEPKNSMTSSQSAMSQ